jgi:uncharacterized protein
VPNVLDEEAIRALHRRYAPTPEAFELVFTHCEIVAGIAAQLIERGSLPVDAGLVRAGSLLHDIGVHRLGTDPYIRHGVLGEELLRQLGLPGVLSRFCSHHTGVGLTRDDVRAQGLPLPPADYLAGTAEEELVMYADKFHSKTSPPVFLTAAAYAGQVARFGADKAARFAAMVGQYGEPELTALSERYGHPIVVSPRR